jgi:hypothetical protein
MLWNFSRRLIANETAPAEDSRVAGTWVTRALRIHSKWLFLFDNQVISSYRDTLILLLAFFAL